MEEDVVDCLDFLTVAVPTVSSGSLNTRGVVGDGRGDEGLCIAVFDFIQDLKTLQFIVSY